MIESNIHSQTTYPFRRQRINNTSKILVRYSSGQVQAPHIAPPQMHVVFRHPHRHTPWIRIASGKATIRREHNVIQRIMHRSYIPSYSHHTVGYQVCVLFAGNSTIGIYGGTDGSRVGERSARRRWSMLEVSPEDWR